MTFFEEYLEFTAGTEVPVFLNRWCALVGLGAWLKRDTWLQHGHATINPNIYAMIIGKSGSRKSTAIKTVKELLKDAGYTGVAADKTTKEKFLMDLAGVTNEDLETKAGKSVDLDSLNLWGDDNDIENKEPACCFIAADEFNDFFGNNNMEFISVLGSLWDYKGNYESRVKHGKQVVIPQPTISMLGGNTAAGFNFAFPPESLGQGFFSRTLLIHGEASGRKITFPPRPSPEKIAKLIGMLHEIRRACQGEVTLSNEAATMIDRIYLEWQPLDDVRFDSYSTRRLTHLLKLCLVTAAARASPIVNESDVLYANTLLTHTEHLMPKALGEFGKGKNSGATQKILDYLEAAMVPKSFQEIFKNVRQDIDSMTVLATLIANLIQADKIQNTGKSGYLIKKGIRKEVSGDLLDFSLLTNEERGI
jgi:energy-coupling factor transporter ATP-binding protein EcfA2